MSSYRSAYPDGTLCDPTTNWASYVADLIRPHGPPPAVMLVVAHPDDEAIGVGAQIARLRDVFVVHVTDGAPKDMKDARGCGFQTRIDYAQARRKELERAMLLAGLPSNRLFQMNYADQEASLNLVELAGALAKLFCDIRPGLVLTHPYEGGHPDHDATAFAVHIARHLLQDYKAPLPMVIEMAFYHMRSGSRSTGEFITRPECPVSTARLTPQQIMLKRKMFDCYVTQRNILKTFPQDVERFRPAPLYHFQLPPHDGKLFYENFDWGMTGARWRDLARDAQQLLGIPI